MPIYVYRNLVTNATFEHEQRITEDALTVDPRTGDPVKRLIQPVGIAFKGSGFYVNDSRGTKSGSAKAAAPVSAAGDGTASSEPARPSGDAGHSGAGSSTTSTSGSAGSSAGSSTSSNSSSKPGASSPAAS